uniref:Uncharacterized protein n=1 Tax=Oryza sativa subsp. japonica TaxID=39947 RepID=Q10N08_ORYSJ|nr:hypothetical protein LOC_Os03g17820 [Oryza sativa Japonica Group]
MAARGADRRAGGAMGEGPGARMLIKIAVPVRCKVCTRPAWTARRAAMKCCFMPAVYKYCPLRLIPLRKRLKKIEKD